MRPVRLGGVFLLLLLAVLSSTQIMLLVKFIVDFLSIGFSPGKTVLLLAFLCVTLLSEPLRLPWKPSWRVGLLSGIFILHAIAVLERLDFAAVATDRSALVWNVIVMNGRLTTSKLSHIHEPKAAIAWLTGYHGTDFDSGFPFISFFPDWLLGVHISLLMLVVLLAFLVCHQFCVTQPAGRTITLCLCVFSLLKGAMDGGPLSTEAAAPLPILLALLYGRAGAKAGGGILLLHLPLTFLFVPETGYLYQILKVLGCWALLSLPLLVDRALASRSRLQAVQAVFCLALLLVLPWTQGLSSPHARRPPYTLGVWLYGRTPLVPGQQLTIFSPRDISQIGRGLFRTTGVWKGQTTSGYRVEVLVPTNPLEICDKLGLNLTWRPITWEQRVVYCELDILTDRPIPPDWPTSELVRAFTIQDIGARKRIHFVMQGDGGMNAAMDALPPGSVVVMRYRESLDKPPLVQWSPGPGAR